MGDAKWVPTNKVKLVCCHASWHVQAEAPLLEPIQAPPDLGGVNLDCAALSRRSKNLTKSSWNLQGASSQNSPSKGSLVVSQNWCEKAQPKPERGGTKLVQAPSGALLNVGQNDEGIKP